MKLNVNKTMISEELITFKTAQFAKQAGFNAPCFYYYNVNQVLHEPYLENGSSTDCDFRVDLTDLIDNRNCKSYKTSGHTIVSAPTQSLLQRWIREVHNCHVEVTSRKDYNDKIVYTWDIYDTNISDEETTDEEPLFDTYELALEQALQEALILIINRKDDNLS